MALDRWIALIFLLICLAYGYAAFFTMDGALPPFMRRAPIWPSTFPKVLAVLGILTALFILLGFEKPARDPASRDIDYTRLGDYHVWPALALVALMIAYALFLRPIGFLFATSGFLIAGGLILGERRLVVLIAVAVLAAFGVWYLVQEVLGIFLRPWPWS